SGGGGGGGGGGRGGVDSGSARWDHELSARLSAVRGVDRGAGGRRGADRRGARRVSRGHLPGGARPGRVVRRTAAVGVLGGAAGARLDRYRVSVPRGGRSGALSAPACGGDGAAEPARRRSISRTWRRAVS